MADKNRLDLTSYPLPKSAQGKTFFDKSPGYVRLRRAFRQLVEDPGLGVLTAEAGVGKTAALRNLCAELPRPDHLVMYFCDTTVAPLDLYRALADELGVSAPRVGARIVRGEVGNALWPARAAHAPMEIGPTRAPPFLILTARFDGATPMTWAQEMRDVLANDSAIVVYQGVGHTRAPDVECLGRAAVAHLLDPASSPPSTCAAVDP